MPLGMRVARKAPLPASPRATTQTRARRWRTSRSFGDFERLSVGDAEDGLDHHALPSRQAHGLHDVTLRRAPRKPADVRDAVSATQHELHFGAHTTSSGFPGNDDRLPGLSRADARCPENTDRRPGAVCEVQLDANYAEPASAVDGR